jgi:hypothetical protein
MNSRRRRRRWWPAASRCRAGGSHRRTRRAEKYNIDAYTIVQAMNEKASAGDYSGALREFEQLSSPRKLHIASVHWPKAVEEGPRHPHEL